MIHGSQTVSPVDEHNPSSSQGDSMGDEEDDDRKSLEESLADGSVSDPKDSENESEIEKWLDRIDGNGDQEYNGGDEVIHPAPAPQAEERPARRREPGRSPGLSK